MDNSGMPDIYTGVDAASAEPLTQPQSKTDLFMTFSRMALQGFGGVLTVVQRELVERKRWMTLTQFIEEWSVAQIMPGPNVVNLCLMIGGRYFGLPGALAALAGLLFLPLVLVLVLAIAFGGIADSPYAQGALRGMGAVAAGLIVATGLKLSSALPANVMGWRVCLVLALLTFAAVGLLRWPLALVLLGLGVLASAYAYAQLAAPQGEKELKSNSESEQAP
jgi:chromate transporter